MFSHLLRAAQAGIVLPQRHQLLARRVEPVHTGDLVDRNTKRRCLQPPRRQWKHTAQAMSLAAAKAMETQGKSAVLATKAVKAWGKGNVLAATAVEAWGKGAALAAKAVGPQD